MSSGGGGGGSQSTTNQVILPQWAQDQVTQNIATANQLAAQPYTPYGGSTVAGFTPDELQEFQQVRDNVGSTTPTYNQAISNVSNLPATTQSLLTPYMQTVGGAVSGSLTGESTAQQGAANANAPNVSAFGGAKGQAYDTTLANETQRNISQAMAQIQNTGWNSQSALALQQAGAMGNLASSAQTARLVGDQALGSVGQQQQEQTQAEYSNALQQWQQAQNWPYQQLSIAESALSGTPYGNTVQSSQPYTSNSLLQGLGLATAAVPAITSIANMFGPSQPAINDYNTGYVTYMPGQQQPVDTGNWDLYNYGAPQ